MGLDKLKPASGSRKPRKRVGRGTGSGLGRTCGRGHKGQNARAGGKTHRGFEGGQMPLHRRLPKRGFTNRFAKQIMTVNLKDLNRFEDGTEIYPEDLVRTGLIRTIGDGVKILAFGDLQHKLTVAAHFFSQAAIQKIEQAGGAVKILPVEPPRRD